MGRTKRSGGGGGCGIVSVEQRAGDEDMVQRLASIREQLANRKEIKKKDRIRQAGQSVTKKCLPPSISTAASCTALVPRAQLPKSQLTTNPRWLPVSIPSAPITVYRHAQTVLKSPKLKFPPTSIVMALV